jgi:putative membrane protein
VTGWEGTYCGPAPLPTDLALRWNFDAFALLVLALLAVPVWRSPAGIAAIGTLAIALVSPLCALSSALFGARVVHHVLLVAVAAPLLAIAWPARARAGVGLPFLLATATLWLWHVPGAYDAALGDMGLYWVMQASLFGTAVWFWRSAFSHADGAGAAWVFLAYLAMGLLGALLTFAPDPLYATHAAGPLLWGLTPLQDQQLGGLIMWMPAGLPFAVWGALLARRAWRDIESAT